MNKKRNVRAKICSVFYATQSYLFEVNLRAKKADMVDFRGCDAFCKAKKMPSLWILHPKAVNQEFEKNAEKEKAQRQYSSRTKEEEQLQN